MNEIEAIQRYIAETNISTRNIEASCMYVSEMRALYREMQQDAYNAMSLIFNYGRAKGYRAAKVEAKK